MTSDAPHPTDPPDRSWRERLSSHPLVRWGERLLWVALGLFLLNRLGPQLSALTGIGPTLGAAPVFALSTLEGETIASADLRGRVVVVNFWATWCGPCRIEIPALQALHERRAQDGVVVLGVSTDVAGRRVVAPYLEARGVTYPVALATPEVRRVFGGISALPTTFVIGRDGTVRHRVVGLFAPPALNAAVARLLEESPPG